MDFRAHQYGLRVAELELAVAVHAVDGGRVLLRLSHASRTHVLRGAEGRGIGALGEVRRHDLLGEVAVDGGGLGAARDGEPKHSPQAVVLVLLLRRQVRRGLVDRVGVEHAVAVRDEDAVRVLDDLQVPVGELLETCEPGELRANGDHQVGQRHVRRVHRRHVLVADLREERVLHDGDAVQIAAFLVRLQGHRLLDGDEVVLRVVVVVAAALRARGEEGMARRQGGGGGKDLRGQLGQVREVHLADLLPRGLDLAVNGVEKEDGNGGNVQRVVVAALVGVVVLLLLAATLVGSRGGVVVVRVVVVAIRLCVNHYA